MATIALTRRQAGLPLVGLALALGIGAVLLEAVFDVPLRAPGHRALPGALALLLFAEAFAPLVLVALALAVSAALTALGAQPPVLIAVWLLAAGALALAGDGRLRRSVWFFLLAGLAFGLLRWLALLPGVHHAPLGLRLGGHLGFGGGAGLLAWAALRLLPGARKETSCAD